ncbi:MAG: M36 family metallopeptidase [Acidobacteria bacterium]|nr:M36 family metallopeptidase [Acidobacteriota bacterium]
MSRALPLLALLLLAAVFVSGQQRPPAGSSGPGAAPNFDIRSYKADPDGPLAAQAADYFERMLPAAPDVAANASARRSGEASLRAAFRDVTIEAHPTLATPEIVGRPAGNGFLSGPSDDRVAALRTFLGRYAAAYGITASDAVDLVVVADYANPSGNMGWVELEQRIHGIPVFQGTVRGGFTAKGELARTTGTLASGVVPGALSPTPGLSPEQAIATAADSVGWLAPENTLTRTADASSPGRTTFTSTTMAGDAVAWLTYFPIASGAVRLAWATEIMGDPDAFLTLVDAETATVLFRKNLTNYQTQAASYNVYAGDSPAPSGPTSALPGANYQAPVVARQTFTLIGNEAPNTFNTLGWMTDGVNVTDGNNVEAGMDLVSPDGVDAPVTGTARSFTFAYNPAPGNPGPGDAPTLAAYRNGEGTNMFYWSNRFHDEMYRLGFTEAARNFQHDNFGRGGAGGDRVRAEGQDSSGTSNADFTTPADGGRGRMQMYVFTGPNPDRSSGLDQQVLLHELGHGLSNRLHANASGLSSGMSGGMGEGWSDFYAMALLSTAAQPVTGIYATGGWLTNALSTGFTDNYYYGIRRFPYALRSVTGGPSSRPHNPLTFADIDPTQINLGDGAFAYSSRFTSTSANNAFQVHNVGEIWAMALLEVRARFIARLGFASGNQRILQFVTDGMKLDPANPTFVQGRDAILAAAAAGGGTAADIADIWAGFAVRGIGALASAVGPDSSQVVESFLTPSDPLPTLAINDVTASEGQAGTTTFAFTVSLANPGAGEHRVSYATADGTAQSLGVAVGPSGGATIPSSGPASVYPLTVPVSGVAGTITSLAVRLEDVTHTFPSDLDILLVGPGGQRVMLMSDVGSGTDLNAVDLTLVDGAPAMTTGPITTGTYAPTDLGTTDSLPGPAPARPFSTDLSVFNGLDANGTWQLYVTDDAIGDLGSIGGFTLFVSTTSTGAADYTSATGQLVFPPGTTTQTINIAVNGDLVPEATETFVVNLSSAVGAYIADGQGIGTILDDDNTPTAQPPTGLTVSSIVGNTVTLTWTPPAFGLTPTGYLLEGGVSPGSVLASLPLGATPMVTFGVPTGSFFVRIHTLAGGQRSGASNEVPLHVNVPVAPSAPANLLGAVSGSALTLAWTNTFGGGAPTGIVLDVSGALSASLPLGPVDSFAFDGVPPGTYTFRMRATNAAGGSAPSSPVTLTFPGGCSGVPLAPARFRALKSGGVLLLSWDLPGAGPAPAGFVLGVTSAVYTGSLPLGGARAFSTPAPPGTYTFTLRGVNACGTGAATAPQAVTIP